MNLNGLENQPQAIDFDKAFCPLQEFGNRVFFDYTDTNYVVLYGCDKCKSEYETDQRYAQDVIKTLYEKAFSYTDFFTLEAQFSFTNSTAYAGIENGICIEENASKLKSCFSVTNTDDQTETNNGVTFSFGRVKSYLLNNTVTLYNSTTNNTFFLSNTTEIYPSFVGI